MAAKLITRENFRKLEAWLLSLALGFFIFGLLIDSRNARNSGSYLFREHKIAFHYFENFFIPMLISAIIVYAVLMLMVLVIEPWFERDRSALTPIFASIGVLFIAWLGISVCRTYIDAWKFGILTERGAHLEVFLDTLINCMIALLIYFSYYILKQVSAILLNRIKTHDATLSRNTYKIIGSIAFWFMLLLFLAGTGAPNEIIVLWAVGAPYSTIIVLLNVYWLIPTSNEKRVFDPSYFFRLGFVVVSLDIVASIFFSAAHGVHRGDTVIIFILLFIWTAVVLVPLSWYIYKSMLDTTKLVRALGKSDASLSFLKSQINPHFLFNALNTLYGTALQEQADRTGEGIQKLGDMMRFMLQENVQDKIALTRDIDYLNNYIDLQKLRTSRSGDITIETKIEEQLNHLEISPMLLIPFVENAFKHGISLQEPSFIKISLQTKENKLFFDVHNSIHIKADNDPEKLKSGIGLPNVKQRLALFYPGKHELIIRESAKEFFVHLTIELSKP